MSTSLDFPSFHPPNLTVTCHRPAINYKHNTRKQAMTMINTVDETSLAASPTERRNSLEKHLLNRPDPQDLKERHILLDTNVAPSIQAARQELDRQRTTDSLKKHLEHRPDREELVERNILPHTNAAPALQAHARELEKHMLADHLDQKIQNRPQPEDLMAQGILTEDEDPRQPTI